MSDLKMPKCKTDSGRCTPRFFENQSLLGQEYLLAYAESAGLDTGRFLQHVKSVQAARRVEEDIANGLAGRVESTPSFFINNMLSAGPYDIGIHSTVVGHVADGEKYKKVMDNYELSCSKQ